MTTPANQRHGVILFAHGSRDPLWRGPIEAMAALARELSPGSEVQCAYLELCGPTLQQAVQNMALMGVGTVRLLPVFFGMGKHTREDLPEILRNLHMEHPDMAFELLPPAGEHPQVAILLARYALGLVD